MKLKTRMWCACATMIILPMILTFASFMGIGLYIAHDIQRQSGIEKINYRNVPEQIQSLGEQTENLFQTLKEVSCSNENLLEDAAYLDRVNDEAMKHFSFIIVRKDGELYYSKNLKATGKIFDSLPSYGHQTTGNNVGYYYGNVQKLVKQIDFQFSDGSKGSIFIVTAITTLISKTLLIDMIVAIILILIFTSIVLTRWIQKSVIKPISTLNVAMQEIAEGNLDYIIVDSERGEFRKLYQNYEDMRLRLKESTDEKFQSERQNKEMISNISHDLKTPITAIKGYVEGIIDGVADTPEKINKYVKTIYNKANDMDRLINELTYYSGIDTNRIPYNFHRLNVSEYFNDCVEEVGLDLESKNIELNYSNFVDDTTRIIADPEQLKKVINNIIGNSIKYMDKEKGEINIRILDEVDSIRVEIEDNGKGVAQKDLGMIFERFYRTDASRNSSKGGSGIGLSIVKKIVEDHGGYIWATSKEEEGTCIHFVIRKYKEVVKDEQDIDSGR